MIPKGKLLPPKVERQMRTQVKSTPLKTGETGKYRELWLAGTETN